MDIVVKQNIAHQSHPPKTKASQPQSDAAIHHLIGGALCLDFANTLYGHGKTPLHEYLFDYRDLVLWSRHAGSVSDEIAAQLVRKAERFPDDARVVFHRAIALRETLFRFFDAVAHHTPPQSTDLAALDLARLQAISHSHVDRVGKGYALDWDDKTALDQMLWQIAVSAVELMTSENVTRVRECRGDACDWLFVDTSRNHLRRWCSMSACGNRSKARRFMQRQRKRTTRA